MKIEARDIAAKNAAQTFAELTPAYLPCPENLEAIVKWFKAHPDADPTEVNSFQSAFSQLSAEGKLKMPEPTEPELTDADYKTMSADEFRKRIVEPQFAEQKRKAKPDVDPFAGEFWAAHPDVAPSKKNSAILLNWLFRRDLAPTQGNLHVAYESTSSQMEPSDLAISRMSSDEFKRRIIDPEFREIESKRPKPERKFPMGVRYTRYLHDS
jgi:hypothetical protein